MKHIFWVQFCWNRTPVFSHPWYEKRCVKKMPCTLWLNLYITCDVGYNRQTLYDSETSIQIQKLTCYDMKTLEFVLLWNNCFKRRKQQRKFYNQNNPSKIRVITKLPNTEQSSKGKGKTHKSTTGKLGKPQWPWLGTGISKEMVGWFRLLSVKRFRLSL